MIDKKRKGNYTLRPFKAILNSMEEKKENIQNPALDEKLMKARTLIISGEISMESAYKFAKELLVLDGESDEGVTVYIDSPGGDVYSGFAIYDMIKACKAKVNVVGLGLVASAAALIYLAAEKDRRYSLPNSTYLIHQPLSEMKGVAIDMDIQAEKIGRLRKKLDSIISDGTGMPLEKVTTDTERDHWLDAEEALEYGIVGKVIHSLSEII